MRRLITLFFLVFTLSGVAFAQQMSDDQVVQYVKSAQQMGKNQKPVSYTHLTLPTILLV